MVRDWYVETSDYQPPTKVRNMKNRIWKRCQLLIVLGGFGFALGCASEPGPTNASAESLDLTATATTNQVEATQSEVTSEPIQTVPPVPIQTSPGVGEVIKLVQGGVDESVILIYIENSESFGELTSEEITYPVSYTHLTLPTKRIV